VSSQARILVVDDRERTVEVIKRVLQKAGYKVLTAFDGVTGLEKARREQPDLIILDVMMPGMDGYEVCRRLQSHADTAHIAVLMLTGKGRLEHSGSGIKERMRDQIQGFEVGATEFLTKPIRAKELVERVKGLLWLDGV
jgi:two-component system alkaline phosphatase synthesis response regulator PhoP